MSLLSDLRKNMYDVSNLFKKRTNIVPIITVTFYDEIPIEEQHDVTNLVYDCVFDDEKHDIKSCYICLEEFKNNQDIQQVKTCNYHIFHEHCISTWLKINPQCPTCRM